MSYMNGIIAALDSLSGAKAMGRLFGMSDHELKAHGLDRDALARGYISGLSAR
jgi:hypothetical protein